MRIIDSHTEGEPTRVVIEGFPELPGATMMERREAFRSRHDDLRRKIILEPRGYDAVVGALLTPPVNEGSDFGVIFFNDSGYLGMCGHGTIGVARTLEYLGRFEGEEIVLDTPVGVVKARKVDGEFEIENVESWAYRLDVTLRTPSLTPVGEGAGGGVSEPPRPSGERGQGVRGEAPNGSQIKGDIAYGGNWFFLTETQTPIIPANIAALMVETHAIRNALREQGITGESGAEIDHIELFQGDTVFVLCPGAAWDRSPCGTGTSAKMATLAARGKLSPGETWTQRSVVGGRFFGHYERVELGIKPFVRGRAFIVSESTFIFESGDFVPL